MARRGARPFANNAAFEALGKQSWLTITGGVREDNWSEGRLRGR